MPEAYYRVVKDIVSDSKSYKDRGILVTDSMAWSNHVSVICSCAYTSLYVKKEYPGEFICWLEKEALFISSKIPPIIRLSTLASNSFQGYQEPRAGSAACYEIHRSDLQGQIDFTSSSTHVHVV